MQEPQTPEELAAVTAELDQNAKQIERLRAEVAADPNRLPSLEIETIDSISDPHALPIAQEAAGIAELERLGLPIGGDPIGEQMMQHIYEGRQISALEYHLAEVKLDQLQRDKAWVARYMDGDPAAARELLMLHTMMLNGAKAEAAE